MKCCNENNQGETIIQSEKWLNEHNLNGYIARLVLVISKSHKHGIWMIILEVEFLSAVGINKFQRHQAMKMHELLCCHVFVLPQHG
jgi:hypothetical protein